ncbi:hypothetical protein COEREDRAFT_92158 [Coemansia reversa NRRL 1564]|uniref:Sds3-like-domain-containing protein n=1 Tax=Coemansia reversa (strain ATCC 12441 / NRRL 1564) TaxID=763665 RepID=A0A2G5BDK1_COERN|nr:hypothetical protein COEREDRAFT_92158 [Coemansia reversa NRRL 1564]|eukprot:PIA17096.1 hypothetical protein COEREDRAFT_92158 [Coemansia reversa NRRL 1564]
MVGGRRRRRSSASSNTSNSKSNLNTATKTTLRLPPSVKPDNPDISENEGVKADVVHEAITGSGLARLTANDVDDPFAYDSELDTLSTVSSRSSISSSNGSLLEQALGISAGADLHPRQSSSEAGDSISRAGSVSKGLTTVDQRSPESADMAIHSEDMVDSLTDDTPSSDKDGLESNTSKDENGRKRRKSKSEGFTKGYKSTDARSRRSSSAVKKETTRRTTRRQDNASDNSAAHKIDSDNVESPHQEAPVSSTILESDEHGEDYIADAAETTVAGEDIEAVLSKGGDKDIRSSRSSSVEDEDAVADETRRSAALTELTNIEIEFAQLRERLYCERLQQVQIEEDYLLSGQHTEYERCVEDLSKSYAQQLEKLRFAHDVWLEQREHLHQTWIRTVNYTSLVQRQELRRRMISLQQRRIWRLRDKRIQEDQRYADRVSTRHGAGAVDENIALIAQQSSESLMQHRQARRVARTSQRCMVHSRKQRLAVPGLDPAEMDADYMAMDLPVYPREPQTNFRRIFVPPLGSEPNPSTGKKRKPRQPRQPRKRPALEKGRSAGKGGSSAMAGSAAQDTSRPALSAFSPRAAEASPLATNIPAKQAASPGFGQARTSRMNGQNSAVTSPARILQALHPVVENGSPPPTALSKSSLQSASPPSIASATTVIANPSVISPSEKNQNSNSSTSSSDRNAHVSVDMHVPSSNSGVLGLKV